MKITNVRVNNRRQVFEVDTRSGSYVFPFAAVRPSPSRSDRVAELSVDADMGREGFVYQLESGAEGAVHIDHVLEYNEDPSYLADQLLYELTLLAKQAVEHECGSVARALATVPRALRRPLFASFSMGGRVIFCVMPGPNPPPWMTNLSIIR